MAETVNERLLLTVEEAARRLGIGRSLAWRLVRSGELPSVRLGRLVRVPERKLQAWLDWKSDEGDRWAVVPRRTRRR
jgi:excisionase family DNA binding protein